MTQRYYIAFSIAGTNCFVTATKRGVNLDKEPGFSTATSRRPDFNPRLGIKLNYEGLTHSSGRPHTDPTWVMRAFRKLENLGWEVQDTDFKAKFFAHMRSAT